MDNLTPEEMKTLIQESLSNVLSERARIDQETHAIQHQWIAVQMEKEKVSIDFRRAMIKGASQWLMLGVLTALATRIWTGHWPQL